jgi:hypothetical protein
LLGAVLLEILEGNLLGKKKIKSSRTKEIQFV